jgi:hypothetical protein
MIEIGTLVRINTEGYYNIDMVGVNNGDFGIVVDSWAEVAEGDTFDVVEVLYDILVSGCTLVPYLLPHEFDVVA